MYTTSQAGRLVCDPGVNGRFTLRTSGKIRCVSWRLERFIRDRSVWASSMATHVPDGTLPITGAGGHTGPRPDAHAGLRRLRQDEGLPPVRRLKALPNAGSDS